MTLTPPICTVELVGIALVESKRKQTGWLLFVDNRLRAIWIEFMVVMVNIMQGECSLRYAR